MVVFTYLLSVYTIFISSTPQYCNIKRQTGQSFLLDTSKSMSLPCEPPNILKISKFYFYSLNKKKI